VAPLQSRNSNLWSIKYNVYVDQHRHVTKKNTVSRYLYYDCRGANVGDRGSMAWMFAYKAVSNLRSMISMPFSGFLPKEREQVSRKEILEG
jgi:hypothetical protein